MNFETYYLLLLVTSGILIHICINILIVISGLFYNLLVISCKIIIRFVLISLFHLYLLVYSVYSVLKGFHGFGIYLLLLSVILIYKSSSIYIYIFYYIGGFLVILVRFIFLKYVFIFFLVGIVFCYVNPERIIFIRPGLNWTWRGGIKLVDKGFVVLMGYLNNMEGGDEKPNPLADLRVLVGIFFFLLLSPSFVLFIYSPFIWDYFFVFYIAIFCVVYLIYLNFNFFIYSKYKKMLNSSYIMERSRLGVCRIINMRMPYENWLIRLRKEGYFFIRPGFNFIIKMMVIMVFIINVYVGILG